MRTIEAVRLRYDRDIVVRFYIALVRADHGGDRDGILRTNTQNHLMKLLNGHKIDFRAVQFLVESALQQPENCLDTVHRAALRRNKERNE